MGIVGVDMSMSLDGYITGPNPGPASPLGEGGERIFAWMMAEPVAAAAPDPGPERSEAWEESIAGRELSEAWDEQFSDAFSATGAVIMGKRMFEIIDNPNGWVAPDGTAFPWPVFVLTHETREPETKGITRFTFVNDGPERALEQARAVAGDKNIGVSGGNVIQQFIRAGLVDAIAVHLVPVFLGGGVRLFGNLGIDVGTFDVTSATAANGVTHLTLARAT